MLLRWLLFRWLPLNGFFLHSYFLDDCSLDGCFWDGYFLDGCFLDSCLINLLYKENPLGETGFHSKFLGYLSTSPANQLGFWELWRSPAALSPTPTAFRCPFFLTAHASSFWFTSLFPTQKVRLPLATYSSLCSTYVTYMRPCRGSSHQVLSIQPLPREAEDFPRGGNHSWHVPVLTCLAWL